MTEGAIAGGCLCGRVRYGLTRVPDDVAHCHCSLCQRSAGAPFVTWATVARNEMAVAGEPRWYRSSARARRGFCPDCGTQLFFAQDVTEADAAVDPFGDRHGGTAVDITVASLDAPGAVRPTRNIWVGTRLAFLDGFDATLPDVLDEGPAEAR